MISKIKFSGFSAILLACLFSSLVGAAFFKAHLEDPHFSSFSGSFVRVLTNLVLIMILMMFFKYRSSTPLLLPPHQHKSLWAWGLFGALTVTTYFAAIHLIGSGMTAFLGASSGVFIAALSAPVARQRTPPIMWLAIMGSVFGMYLLCNTTNLNSSGLGCGLAIASGFFGAVAYLMIARTRSRYSVPTVMMTWCISALAAHLILFCAVPIAFPTTTKAWIFILIAAVSASMAQQLTTLAFQRSSASFVASLSYLTPVLSLLLDFLAFDLKPKVQTGLGALLIIAFGALIPSLKLLKKNSL